MKNNSPNALINETSPYLLQHAYNPVQWYPWGDEALQLAKEKDLPILVSIGYSACHWCHVMERESFEDAETAAFMNRHFINIKIDREERPDLDHIYMDAVQAISGSGGWPLNVFLTTATKPFYGGTYFPPKKAFNRPSWLDVLFSMSEYWKNKRAEVEEQANGLIEHLTKSNKLSFKSVLAKEKQDDFYSLDKCKLIADNILANADKKEGGFGLAPKFLQTASIQYLLQYAYLSGNEVYREQALLSLKKMYRGGIYDQLAGGISRYSTDNEWLVPHFEKMLYDNALLVTALCDAWQLTKQLIYKEAIITTLNFVINELHDKNGGYYTALDADSEGVEGKFYVWEKREIETILENEAAIFCDYYNVSDTGNWEEANILNVKTDTDAFALAHKMDTMVLKELLKKCAAKLLSERNKRVRPGLDDKILLNCNALLLTAFCKAYSAVQLADYKSRAIELAAFIEQKFSDKNAGLLHTYKEGNARYPAFLDDYAYYIAGLILLQEITGNQQYLWRARDYTNYVMAHFSDEEENLFYYTGIAQNDIVVRKTEVYDGATPSANAVMANNLFYLSIVFDEPKWEQRAAGMLQTMYAAVEKYPGSFGIWAAVYLRQAAGIEEIVVTGNNNGDMLNQVLERFIPNKVLQSTGGGVVDDMPLLLNRLNNKKPTIYVCRNYSCLSPVFSIEAFIENLKKHSN
ncbi:MAG: thioredoxin domain-containing protein [Sphingobacteriales bacterium]|nr:MAG: thioredoxin domain-containing protein [Sphingobacteriales bacterium]